jgi:hypothetical protein
VARLLAYALCYEPDLVFTKGSPRRRARPLAQGGDGQVELWLEVSLPTLIVCSRPPATPPGRSCSPAAAPALLENAHWRDTPSPIFTSQPDYNFVQQVAIFCNAHRWSVTVTDGTST